MPAYESSRLRVALPLLLPDGSFKMESREIAMALIPEKGRWRSVDPVAAGRRVGPRAATVYHRALWTDGVELVAPKGLIPVFLPVGSGLVELPGENP